MRLNHLTAAFCFGGGGRAPVWGGGRRAPVFQQDSGGWGGVISLGALWLVCTFLSGHFLVRWSVCCVMAFLVKVSRVCNCKGRGIMDVLKKRSCEWLNGCVCVWSFSTFLVNLVLFSKKSEEGYWGEIRCQSVFVSFLPFIFFSSRWEWGFCGRVFGKGFGRFFWCIE